MNQVHLVLQEKALVMMLQHSLLFLARVIPRVQTHLAVTSLHAFSPVT